MFNVLGENVPSQVEAYLPQLGLKLVSMLRPGGKAYIGEWYTPEKVQKVLEFDFEQYGLRVERIRTSEGVATALGELGVSKEKIDSIVRDFEVQKASGKGEPFLLVLTQDGWEV